MALPRSRRRRCSIGRRTLATTCVAAAASAALAPPPVVRAASSIWVKVGASGRLVYTMDDLGDRIPDYSDVGYMGGTVALPVYNQAVTADRIVNVTPLAGGADNLAQLQAAINAVAARPLNVNGFRGVIQLAPGNYPISAGLSINTSGIILRGTGDNGNNAVDSTLAYTGTSQIDMIHIDSSSSRSTNTTHNITDKLVPVGAMSFSVDSTSGYNVGDTIYITRPSPQNWINDIHMDASVMGAAAAWTAGSKDQSYERKITYIDQTNHRIMLDAPMVNSVEQQYGGATVQKYTFARTQNVGVENLRANGQLVLTTPDDEMHANSAVVFQDTANSWVQNITGQHLIYATVEAGTNARNITVTDSASIEPISIITGGRRYPFNIEGAFVLMKNLTSDEGRHEFVNNSPSRGPNVFLDSVATHGHADSGTHQRWSVGTLWDNITTNTDLDVQNRYNSGTGHGWSGANMVIWNSKASDFYVQQPPTAQNWIIGSQGTVHTTSEFPPSNGSGNPSYPPYSDDSGTGFSSKVTLNGETSLYRAQLNVKTGNNEQVREYWTGDFDGYVNDGASDTVPVDATWKTAVMAFKPANTVVGFDGSLTQTNISVPFTMSFDAPGTRVSSAVLTLAVHSANNGSFPNDRIYIEDTAKSILFSSLGTLQHFGNSDIVTLEFTAADAVKTLSTLQDGKLNVFVGDNHAVDWADLQFTVANKAITWTGTTNSTWDIQTTSNWNAGGAELFYNGDDVTFAGGPANRTISIGTTVQPHSVTVNNPAGSDYSFTGVAGIGGDATLTKTGAGVLTISNTNTYTGKTSITGGVVKPTNNNALGALVDTAPVAISGTGQVDIGLNTTANNVNFGAKGFFIQGAGPDGSGAIINSSASQQQNAFQSMGLTGNATIGGTGRFDIRGGVAYLDLAGFTLTKTGANQVSLVGVTVTNGSITVNQGILSIETTATVTGAGSLTFNDATTFQVFATAANSLNISRNVSINGAVRLSNASAQPITIASDMTINGSLNVNPSSTGALTLTGDIGESTPGVGAMTKTTTTTLTLSGNNTFTGGLTISNGIVQMGSATALSPSNPVTFGAAVPAGTVVRLAGFSVGVGGLSTNASVGSPIVENASATPASLTINNAVANTFAGVLQNGTGGGALSLTKTGAGTLTLAGANTYTGTTTISAGTLIVNGSLATAGNVFVNSGATLGGSGSVGQVTMSGAASLSPGNSPGTLSLASLTVNGGDFKLDLNNPDPGLHDVLAVAGTAVFNGASTITPLNFAPSGTYTILTSTGLSGTAPTVSTPAGSRSVYTVHFGDGVSGANNIALTVVGTPKTLTWTGGTNSAWDVINTINWSDNGGVSTNEKFFNQDTVNFGNGVTNRNVTLNVSATPTAVNVNNNASNSYTLTGTGSIDGPTTTLTKSGSGTFTLATNNTYGGATSINDDGTLEIGNGGTTGSLGTAAVTGTGTLRFNRSDNITVNTAINGAVNLTQAGAGVLTLGVANAYSGATGVQNGTLKLGVVGAAPNGTSLVLGAGANSGALDLNGINLTVAALSTTGSDAANVVTTSTGTPTLAFAGGTSTFAGSVQGPVSLSIISGSLTLTAGNSYTGATTVSAGAILQIGNGGASGSIATSAIANAGGLRLNRSDTVTIANLISGAGEVRQAGSGTSILTAANTYTGVTTITSGVLSVATLANAGVASPIGMGNGAAPASASLVLDGGALQWTGAASQSTNRGFTLSQNGGTIDSSPTVASTNLTITGAIAFTGSGPRMLTLTGIDQNPLLIGGNVLSAVIADAAPGQATTLVKSGNNAWNLSGANTYTGGTLVNAGRLRANTSAGAFGTGPVTVAGGAQAYLNVGGTFSNNFSIAGIGIAEQPGAEAMANYGALRLAANGAVVAGSVTLTADARITARSASNTGATITGQITGGFALELGNTGAGSGILILSNPANNWTGNTTISHSTLRLGASEVIPNGAAAGNVTINGSSATIDAILDLNGQSETINGLSSAGDLTHVFIQNSIASTTSTLTLGGNDQAGAFGGVIRNNLGAGGTVALTKIGSGVQTLTGANTYSGATIVSAGTLQVGAGSTVGSLGAGLVTVNGSLVFNRSDTYSLTNAVGGAGVIRQLGSGTLDITGPQSWSAPAVLDAANGTTNVKSDPGSDTVYALRVSVTPATGTATVHLATNATDQAHLRDLQVNAPGSGGDGLLLIDAAATGAAPNPQTGFGGAGGSVAVYVGDGSGTFGVTPRATVEALWRSATTDGYWALINHQVTAITRGLSLAAGVVTDTAKNGLFILPSVDNAGHPVTYVGEDVQGDTNGDGKVDINDLGVVLQHLNTTAGSQSGEESFTLYTPGEGDVNGDTAVNINDLGAVLANLNQVYNPAATGGGVNGIPEPMSMVLLALAAPALLRRRRMRRV